MMTKKHYLKEVRALRDMTQQQLADAVGLTQGAVQKHENGTRDFDLPQLIAYATALDVSIQQIIEGPFATPIYNQEEADLLNHFRGLSEPQKQMFSSMLTTFVNEQVSKKETYWNHTPSPEVHIKETPNSNKKLDAERKKE